MINKSKIRVAVGMSGGVDSTMAAFLLKQKGYDVIGLTMKIWKGSPAADTKRTGCYGPGEVKDIEDAIEAAKIIGIPHHTLDLTEEYRKHVLQYFRESYGLGETPNPCVVCNTRIKFDLLLQKAFDFGINFDYFATGHYARIKYDKPTKLYLLQRGLDKTKDQSYFLYRLQQSQLNKIIFPLGSFRKVVVKKLASKSGFKSWADKKESQNLTDCGDRYYSLLLAPKPGQIIDQHGKLLGQHEGIGHYTIGQRKNLNLGGLKEPYYVLEIDAKKNAVIVGPKEAVYYSSVKADRLNWIFPPELIKQKTIKVKIRSTAPLVGCCLDFQKEGRIVINFTEAQFAPAPGQSAVFYSGDAVLGGGVITL